MSVEQARARFPVLARLAYLNAGTFGPLSRATFEAMTRRLILDTERGRGGAAYFEELSRLRERVRSGLAEVLGVEPANVALTGSTTAGCNIVLGGLGLSSGDEVVTTDAEHFGLLGPLHASGAVVRVARTLDRPAVDVTAAILAEVTSRTRLLALSHVAWKSGHLFPIRELKEATGLPVLVDGAQSVGAIPVEAAPFDFYTVSGQKWLCGPDSTGGLYVADPAALAVAAPSYFSQNGYKPDGRYEPSPGSLRFEPGWVPPSSLAGLAAALEEAPAWRFQRALELTRHCRERLAERFDVATEPDQATLVSFSVDADPTETALRLYERGVVLRDVPGTSWLRVSCGYWTSEEDIERLIEALA